MFSKSVPFMAVAALSLLTAAACTKSNDGGNSLSRMSANSAADSADASVVYTPGVAAHTSDVVSLTIYATEGGAVSNEELAPLYAAYPRLGVDTAELATIDSAVITADSRIELYQGPALVMVFAITDNVATLVWSRSDFIVESTTFTSEIAEQNAMVSALTFNLKACEVLVIEEKAQDQSQDKGQAQEKAQDQAQDKGQSKEPIVEPAKEPVCQTLSATIDMREQPQKQEQKQEQTQDKAQDKDQGKDQGAAQDQVTDQG